MEKGLQETWGKSKKKWKATKELKSDENFLMTFGYLD